ncbi:MAG: hypothetical protein AAB426_12800, partial [Myxococcota bacterium]
MTRARMLQVIPRIATATLVLLVGAKAFAQVTLTDSSWSTSFEGCATGDVGYGDVCDGLTAVGQEYTCGAGPVYHSQVATGANYPGGAGGAGFAVYYESNARNIYSTGLMLTFDPPEPEVWFRFYRAWPAGQTWADLKEHKVVYLHTDDSPAANVNFPQGDDDIALQPRNTMGSPDVYYAGNGWETLNDGSLVGDGAWHAFELHFRLGTSGSNDGLFEMWIDGANVISDSGLDWFDGGGSSPTGWAEIELPS